MEPVLHDRVNTLVEPIDAAIQSEATDFFGGLNTTHPVFDTPSGVSAVLSESLFNPETPEFQERVAKVSVPVLLEGQAITFFKRTLPDHGLNVEFVTVQTPPRAPTRS